MSKIEKTVRELLEPTGIEINGTRPYDIQVHEPGFYSRALVEGELGLGESYMDGWWDCEALDEAIYRILRADLEVRSGGISSCSGTACRAGSSTDSGVAGPSR
jgi:cyclopropane-fatty-acyl-phospholipid synthase